jgi:hypothetical protein
MNHYLNPHNAHRRPVIQKYVQSRLLNPISRSFTKFSLFPFPFTVRHNVPHLGQGVILMSNVEQGQGQEFLSYLAAFSPRVSPLSYYLQDRVNECVQHMEIE